MGKRVYCETEVSRVGRTLICSKEAGHDNGTNPEEIVHYDATARQHFDYPGKIRIIIDIPGLDADVVIDEDVPDNYGAMSEDERLNYRGYREESYRELMNVSAEYVAPGEE
jgi:hypothetical protein